MVVLTDEQFSFFDKALKKLCNEDVVGGNYHANYFCNGASYTLDEEPRYISSRYAACHSWVPDAYKKSGWVINCYNSYHLNEGAGAESFVTLDAHPQKHLACSVESHIHLMDWVAEESFAKDWILNKYNKESLYKRGIMLLCGTDGATCSEAMWLLKVLRHEFEGRKSIDTWSQLVKRGVNPNVAFLVSSRYCGFNFKTSTAIYSGVSSHVNVWNYGPVSPRILEKDGHNRNADCTSDFFLAGPEEFKVSTQDVVKPVKTVSKKVSDGWEGDIELEEGNIEDLVEQCLTWEKQVVEKGNAKNGK